MTRSDHWSEAVSSVPSCIRRQMTRSLLSHLDVADGCCGAGDAVVLGGPDVGGDITPDIADIVLLYRI